MSDLERAGFEMFDAFYDVGGGGSFGEAGGDAGVYVVGEHEFPTSCFTFFTDITLSVDDL